MRLAVHRAADTPTGYESRSPRFDASAVARVFRWNGPIWKVVADNGAAGQTLECSVDYAEALGALSHLEACALEVLEGVKSADTWSTSRALLKRLRRRMMRRYRAEHVSPSEAAKLRAWVDAQLGKRRPVDPVSDLCWRLRDRVGLPPPPTHLVPPPRERLTVSEIIRLLNALGLERPGKGAAERVKARIRRRARAARAKQVPTLGNGRKAIAAKAVRWPGSPAGAAV